MAAQDYTSVVEQLYVSYFGRPADYYGLQNFSAALNAMGAPKTFAEVNAAVQADKAGTSALSKLVNSFNTSAESTALYGTDNSQIGIGKFVNAIYQNVLGRDADKSGFDFWVNAITSGTLTKANAAASITQAALTNTTDQGKLDAKTVQNKLAVATAFTTALDTPIEITSFAGDAAAAAARSLLAGVNSSTDVAAYQATVATSIEGIVAVAVPGQTFALTANIDNLIGTQGNDVFNAIVTATANPFGPLDVIDGGAGRDTLNVADTSGAAVSLGSLTIKNIETLAVSATGAFTAFDISNTGVTTASLTTSATTADTITAADTTNVTLSAAATAGTAVTINGGKTVVVNSAGDNAVTGAALSTVTVKGGTAAIDNTGSTGTSAAGSTLTAVTLDAVSGTNTVAGKGVTTVNLQNIDAAAAVTVTNSTAGHALKLNVNAVDTGDAADIVVTDAIATSVAVTAATDSELTVTAVKATAATVAGAGAIALDLTGSVKLASVDASANTGGVTLTGMNSTVNSITTGSGDDTVTVTTATVKDDTTTTGTDETFNATVSTGAGDDSITVNTTGTGLVTVVAGDGNDTVNIVARGTGLLDVNLGAGNDTFTSAVAIGANDKIDAGAGTDMLALNLVGSANVGAFSNFDAFDAAGLAKALDVNILAAKNSVTEIVASGDVGTSASLINLGAGVTFRATADLGTTDALTLTQKTAGVLTVTVDADETGTADNAIDTASAKIIASNASSINAVFDTSYKASLVTETTAGDNVTTLQLSGVATSVNVTSGGALSNNVLAYADTGTGATGKLATITITGDQALTLSNTFAATASALATVDSSALKGGLTFSMLNLKDGGNVILGSGVDLITVTSASTINAGGTGFESITGFEKTSATAVSTTADATSKAAIIADADMLSLTGAAVASTTTANAGGDVNAKGVLTFTGSGPSTLAAAVAIADTAAETAGESLVFEYLGNTYVFVQGATDTLVQLAGITGVTNLVENGTTDHFFIV
jgi:S-layer protein